MLFTRNLFLLASICLCQLGAIFAQKAPVLSREVNEAEHMLLRGDSLFESSRPVAALAMYRGAEERSFDP